MKLVKSLFAVAVAMTLAGAVSAASLNIYGGTGQTATGSLSSVATQGGSGAVLGGISGTQSGVTTVSSGAAAAMVTPLGTQTEQQSATSTIGGSRTGALGLAGAGSVYGGQGTSGAIAGSTFGTLGLGLNP